MDHNTAASNQISASSLQHVYEAINKMESHMANLTAGNQATERHIESAIQKRKQEINTKRNRVVNITNLLNRLQQYGDAKQRVAKAVQEKVTRSARKCQLQMDKHVEGPVPVFNFIYHINNPSSFTTLSEMIEQIQQNSARERTKREDEIRTLKIRISLAQIQLKQVKNRSKKI